MRNFERNKKNSIMESTPALAILAILALIFLWSVIGLWGKMSQTRRNLRIAREKTELMREQKSALQSDLQKLATDQGKEEFFRENYGLAKTGEEVIVIVEEEKAPENKPRGAIRSFFSSFLNLFK